MNDTNINANANTQQQTNNKPIVGKYGWYDYFNPNIGTRTTRNTNNSHGTVIRNHKHGNDQNSSFTNFIDNRYIYSNNMWDTIEKYAPNYPEVRPETIFSNSNKTVLEVGIGNGEFLINLAENNPETNFIGFEVFKEGATKCIRRCKSLGLSNVRVVHFDAIFYMHLLEKSSISEVYVNFPDPWFKKRHRKRRIINPQFVALVASLLEPEGVLNIATDNEDYATGLDGIQHTLENCASGGALSNMQDEPFTHDDSHYFSTKYYRKFGRQRSYFFKYSRPNTNAQK